MTENMNRAHRIMAKHGIEVVELVHDDQTIKVCEHFYSNVRGPSTEIVTLDVDDYAAISVFLGY